MAHHRTGAINACRSEAQPQTQYKVVTQDSRYFPAKVARNKGTKNNHGIEAIETSGSQRQSVKRRRQEAGQTHHSGHHLCVVHRGRDRRACARGCAAVHGKPHTHLHMVGLLSAVPDLPQKTFVVSRCRRTHRAATVDRHTAGNRLFSRRGHVPDHRHHHHVDHHRTQSDNRHSSRRNHACANPINQNIICEYFSRIVDYYQPAFRQCRI